MYLFKVFSITHITYLKRDILEDEYIIEPKTKPQKGDAILNIEISLTVTRNVIIAAKSLCREDRSKLNALLKADVRTGNIASPPRTSIKSRGMLVAVSISKGENKPTRAKRKPKTIAPR